jgi:phosphate transport system substrate-binding protein
MMARHCALVFMALAVCCSGLACSDSNPKQRSAVGALQLHGVGATFPAPLYKKWLEEYQKQHPDVQLSYKAIGRVPSGAIKAQELAACSPGRATP